MFKSTLSAALIAIALSTAKRKGDEMTIDKEMKHLNAVSEMDTVEQLRCMSYGESNGKKADFLHEVADELESLRAFKADIEKPEPVRGAYLNQQGGVTLCGIKTDTANYPDFAGYLYATPVNSPDVEKLKADLEIARDNLRCILKANDNLIAETQSLKALSVTNIMIDVVPGEDGNGHEVYAKSVEDVVELLTCLSEKAEEYDLTFEFPKHIEHPAGRTNLTAAYLLEYWAKKGIIPRYDGVIDGLRDGAAEIFEAAKPVPSNAALNERINREGSKP